MNLITALSKTFFTAMLSAQSGCDEYHYSECLCAECGFSKCRCAECGYAEGGYADVESCTSES